MSHKKARTKRSGITLNITISLGRNALYRLASRVLLLVVTYLLAAGDPLSRLF